MFRIRRYEESDWSEVWPIIEEVFRKGDTYAHSPEISEEEAQEVWIAAPAETFIAEDQYEQVVGTYYIKPNQPALGSHVCNCGYIVAKHARGQGIASAMCEHSQRTAKALGFKSMQYNLVVSTNEVAIHLWLKHGFHIVGSLPKAFNHRRLGYVDGVVMYKQLET